MNRDAQIRAMSVFAGSSILGGDLLRWIFGEFRWLTLAAILFGITSAILMELWHRKIYGSTTQESSRPSESAEPILSDPRSLATASTSSPGEMVMVMHHDDDCGELLTAEGQCPRCGFSPDTQSTGFKLMYRDELRRLAKTGATFMGFHRIPIKP